MLGEPRLSMCLWGPELASLWLRRMRGVLIPTDPALVTGLGAAFPRSEPPDRPAAQARPQQTPPQPRPAHGLLGAVSRPFPKRGCCCLHRVASAPAVVPSCLETRRRVQLTTRTCIWYRDPWVFSGGALRPQRAFGPFLLQDCFLHSPTSPPGELMGSGCRGDTWP